MTEPSSPTRPAGIPAPDDGPTGQDRPPEVPSDRPSDRPEVLVELLAALDEPALVTLTPAGPEHVDVGLQVLADDPRCGAASLFGLVAPDGAAAAGVCVAGTARPAPRATAPAGDPGPGGLRPGDHVRICLALTVTGILAERVDRVGPDGEVVVDPALHHDLGGRSAPTGNEGLLVDSLHRVLGLPCPGEPPMLWELALGWWLRDVVDALDRHDAPGWQDLVDLHVALAGAQEVPSARAIALATEDVVGDTSWARLHSLAAAAPDGLPDLSAEEARWMDPTLFGRWMVGGLPSAHQVLPRLERCAAGLPRGEGRRLRRLGTRLVAADALLRERSGLEPDGPG